MREIDVLTFGVVTDIVGKSRLAITDAASTDELKLKLENEFPALKKIQYAIAVDRQVVTEPTNLEANAVVAILPPFSGG
jgi:molybdopterin synthase sulfur carrier subunit